MRYVGYEIAPHFFKAADIRYIVQYDDDALLLPALAVVRGKVCIDDAFLRIVRMDFIMHVPVIFQYPPDQFAEDDAFTDFVERLSYDMVRMLLETLFRC